MDSQVEQTRKCTPETLADACGWLSIMPVRDLVVGKVPYLRLPAVARDHLADLLAGASSALSAALALPKGESETIEIEHHGLDTADRVCFYEQDFYVLSNFSSFGVEWEGLRFDTSEHLYHWLKFATSPDGNSCKPEIAQEIDEAPSAHAAFKLAELYKAYRRSDWDHVKVDFMRRILRAKVDQHEYVFRKLMATGERELVENSWRDDFWGWGPNRDGQNMLGKLWMEVRAELRTLNTGGTHE